MKQSIFLTFFFHRKYLLSEVVKLYNTTKVQHISNTAIFAETHDVFSAVIFNYTKYL